MNQKNNQTAEELKKVLADTYALYLKTQNFHWNVTGPNFHTYHLMFEQQYNELALAVDEIAERIRGLGEVTPGGFEAFIKLTSVKEEEGTLAADKMVRSLIHEHETVMKSIHSVYPSVETTNDKVTEDLLNDRLSAHEKTVWMLKSSL